MIYYSPGDISAFLQQAYYSSKLSGYSNFKTAINYELQFEINRKRNDFSKFVGDEDPVKHIWGKLTHKVILSAGQI